MVIIKSFMVKCQALEIRIKGHIKFIGFEPGLAIQLTSHFGEFFLRNYEW
jgi:hypothetical protein